MGIEILVAIYGAGLATAVAVGQSVAWWRKRPKIRVEFGWLRAPLSEANEESVGTPYETMRGNDALREQLVMNIKVINSGGSPIQVVGILIESQTEGAGRIAQLSPHPLPYVLTPGTKIDISMQKEPVDTETEIVFFGVVDALGRRYSASDDVVKRFINESWKMPTRVAVYQRRDDPSTKIVAFQSRHAAELKQAGSGSPSGHAIARRNRPQDWPALEA